MRANDPWMVMRYAPLIIDGTVYFVVSVGDPAGSWRRNAVGSGVAYVDPLTGAEYLREKKDMMQRASFATVDQVQPILDTLKRGDYKAVGIRCGVDGAQEVTLIRMAFNTKVVGMLTAGRRINGLLEEDHRLIAEFSQREDVGFLTGSVTVAARLIEHGGPTRFIRLVNILSSTIWSK